jgi:hypothetical protein
VLQSELTLGRPRAENGAASSPAQPAGGRDAGELTAS